MLCLRPRNWGKHASLYIQPDEKVGLIAARRAAGTTIVPRGTNVCGPQGQRIRAILALGIDNARVRQSVITTSTVLILGAGASASKGFPTGAQLLAEAREAGLAGVVEMIKPVERSHATGLYQAIAGTGDKSLDAMLEHRPDLVEAGKALMARALLNRENTSLTVMRDAGGEWYRDLWAALDANSLDNFQANQLTIVTYNYDRSLEYFFGDGPKRKIPQTERGVRSSLEKYRSHPFARSTWITA